MKFRSNPLCMLLPLLGCLTAPAPAQNMVFTPPEIAFDLQDSFGQTMLSGDFNEDGTADLVVCAPTPGFELKTWLGQGDGSFTAGATRIANNLEEIDLVADFNEDGHLDLAGKAHLFPDWVLLLLGDGSGRFMPPQSVAATGKVLGHARFAAGDVDGDGHLDLVTNTPYAELLLGAGDGSFTSAQGLPGTTGPQNHVSLTTLDDLDDDGRLDLLVGTTDGTQHVHLQLAPPLGGGPFEPVSLDFEMTGGLNNTGPSHAVADVNHDGHVDLMTTNPGARSLLSRLGLGDGSFGALMSVTLPVNNAPILGSHGLTTGDYDGDGTIDVSYNVQDLRAVAFLNGLDDGSFRPSVLVSTPEEMDGSIPLDADQDGRLDLLGILQNSFLEPYRVGWIPNATYGSTQPFVDLGGAEFTIFGYPILLASGSLLPGDDITLHVFHGSEPGETPFLVLGASAAQLPFKGGTLWPSPDVVIPGAPFNAAKESSFSEVWPNTPGGFDFWMQVWFSEPSALKGWGRTTGVKASVP